MMRKSLTTIVTACSLLLVLAGCGGKKEAKMVSVSGTAQINGKPIKKGGFQISFASEKNNGGSATLEVSADGSFSGKVPEGKGQAMLEQAAGSNHGGVDPNKTQAKTGDAAGLYGGTTNLQPVQYEAKEGGTLTLNFAR